MGQQKDLDLYCFYVLKNGESGKVYYKELGKANQAPFITLDGDSKIAGSETIIIHKPEELRYALLPPTALSQTDSAASNP